jgi:hypothetical protein
MCVIADDYDFGEPLSPFDDEHWNNRANKAIHIGSLWYKHVFIYTNRLYMHAYMLTDYVFLTYRWTRGSISRQVVLDLASRRPDIIMSTWTKSLSANAYHPYNSSVHRYACVCICIF